MRILFPIITLVLLNLTSVYCQESINDVRAVYTKGVQYLAANDLKLAESNFIKVIGSAGKISGSDNYIARSYYFLGDVYFIRQDFEKAIGSYKAVVQKYYDEDIYTKTMYKLGRTLILAGLPADGTAMLNDYVIRYQNTDGMADNALYWVGRGYTSMGDFTSAINTYQLVLDKYPSSTLSYEIRKNLDQLNHYMNIQKINNPSLTNTSLTNDLFNYRQRNEKLTGEKALLEKMARLLQIKQRLLEIKAEKVELLSRIREQNSARGN